MRMKTYMKQNSVQEVARLLYCFNCLLLFLAYAPRLIEQVVERQAR